jgi:hypothetical protein
MRTVEITAVHLAMLLDAIDGAPMSANVRVAYEIVSREFTESLEEQSKNGGRAE